MKPLKRLIRNKLISVVRGANADMIKQQQELNQKLDSLQTTTEQLVKLTENEETITELDVSVTELTNKVLALDAISRANFDHVHETMVQVEAMRQTTAYKRVFESSKPLISIRIATYNRSQTLIDKAVASILKQTYQNFEVVIVGDHCSDDTAEKVVALNDKRFSFYNLPTRTVYPEDRIQKWMVIGAPAMNAAAGRAQGDWIAPLDDDDEFSEDHLQKLLDVALETKCEFVYGAMNQHNIVSGEDTKIWSSPPEYGRISLNGSMYLKLLDGIFKYDTQSYVLGQAADWTMVRRMMESGVKLTATDAVIGRLNMIPAGDDHKDY